MVQDVIEVGADLSLGRIRQPESPGQRRIDIIDTRSDDDVAAAVAEGSSSWNLERRGVKKSGRSGMTHIRVPKQVGPVDDGTARARNILADDGGPRRSGLKSSD